MSRIKTDPPEPPEPDFDRLAYLREVRMTILKNLGLPEDAKPEQVVRLLEIKQKLGGK